MEGAPSSVMVFACAKCKTPLMHCAGVTSELDRVEFAKLRERLARVLDVVIKRDGEVNEVANSLKKLVEESNARAEERKSEPAEAISEAALGDLQKNLDDLDVDSFLAKL